MDPRAQAYAINLGMAFQLTNIMRDVGADAERDRIYVPQEDPGQVWLFRGAAISQGPLRLNSFDSWNSRLPGLMSTIEKHKTVYDTLSSADRQSLLSAEIMRVIYFNLLTRIEKTRFAVFSFSHSRPSASSSDPGPDGVGAPVVPKSFFPAARNDITGEWRNLRSRCRRIDNDAPLFL